MKIAVLGGGMVGSLIATELSNDYDVTVFDNSHLDLRNVKTVIRDVTQEGFRKEITDYNIAINCLPGFMGFEMLKTLVSLNVPCVDISFMPEDCLVLAKKAENGKCTVVPDAGVAPGLSNLIVGNIISKNKVKDVKIMVGGLPKKKNPPWNYRAPFSPIDVIEEYTRPARIKSNNEIVVKEALSDIQSFEVEGIGELEAFLTDGLRTLLNSNKKISQVPNFSEYTIRYPGHADLVRKLIENGDFSEEKREETCQELFEHWKLTDEDEFTFMLIVATIEDGKEISYTVYDERTDGWSSMSRTTGLTACAFTELLISKNMLTKGMQCPEVLGMNEENYNFVIEYLIERGIVIKSH